MASHQCFTSGFYERFFHLEQSSLLRPCSCFLQSDRRICKYSVDVDTFMITCRASRKFVLAAFSSIVRKHFRLQSAECFDFEPIRTAIIWRARQLSIIYCKTLDGKLSIPVISLSHLLKCLGGESLSFWLKFGKIWSSFYFQTNSLSQNLEIISGSAIVFVLFLFPL